MHHAKDFYLLLALDTATTTASVALYDLTQQKLLAEYTWEARRRQTQELLPTAQQVLTQLGLQTQALTALAVTTGPGSFTGVRIGISTVKGIGMGLPTRPQVIGIPTLAVTAAPYLDLLRQVQPDGTVCALMQAGRGRYNWTYFCPDALLWRPTAVDHQGGTAENVVDALNALTPSSLWLVGELDEPLAERIVPLSHVTAIDAVSGWRRAGQLARLAALHLAADTQDDLSALQPLYLRNP